MTSKLQLQQQKDLVLQTINHCDTLIQDYSGRLKIETNMNKRADIIVRLKQEKKVKNYIQSQLNIINHKLSR